MLFTFSFIYIFWLFVLKWHNQTHRPDQRRHVQTKQLATSEELPLTQCLWTCQIVKLSLKKDDSIESFIFVPKHVQTI